MTPERQIHADQLPIPFSNDTTSREAAESVREQLSRLRGRVLEAIVSGPDGATDEEIQLYCALGGNTERPRRGELEKLGLIRDSGRTRRTASGRRAIVWVPVDEEHP